MHDVRANRRGAGKGDLGDAFAGGQGLPGFASEALHNIEHARRQQVIDQLGEHHDRQRRLLGRLEHDAVPGGQGRGEFPRGHQQREVPRNDLPDHTQRFVEVVSGGVFIDLGGAAFLGADAAGEITEMVGGQGHVGVEGFTYGLAVVPGFGHGQHFEVLFDAVGDFQQHQGAVLGRGLSPGIGGGVGGIQGFIDVGGAGAWEFSNRLAGDRRGVGEVLAVDRCDELAADVITITLLEADDSARGARLCVDHSKASVWVRACRSTGDYPIVRCPHRRANAPLAGGHCSFGRRTSVWPPGPWAT